jgi:hypothetical protein
MEIPKNFQDIGWQAEAGELKHGWNSGRYSSDATKA